MNDQSQVDTMGTSIRPYEEISMDNETDNLCFARKSKELAKKHEWIYHCTTSSALKSIIKKREFWLSNLVEVNDDKEKKRIDVQEYKNKYYIGCFTSSPQVSDEHWDEYGSLTEGILIGMKKEWFIRNATFLRPDNFKINDPKTIILPDRNKAWDAKIAIEKRIGYSNPFYIESFDFYQVVYSDDLIKNIRENNLYTPSVAGIIKSTHGISNRSKKDRDWTQEKEIRLKVVVRQIATTLNNHELHDERIMKCMFPKIAVPLSDDAFSEIRIGFSPKFKEIDTFKKELQELLPNSNIEML